MDNKALVVGGAILVLISASMAGVYFLVIGRGEAPDYAAVETARANKLDTTTGESGAPTTTFPGQMERMTRRSISSDRVEPEVQSGLTMVKGQVKSLGAPGSSETSQSASDAAARGDVKGMLRGMRAEEDGDVPSTSAGAANSGADSGPLNNKRIRAIMQEVVDGVHNMQPDWYDEFLANKTLKGYADYYHKTNDFTKFVNYLSKSKAFWGLMTKHYMKPEMREMTSEILRDKRMEGNLTEVYHHEERNSAFLKVLAKFGQGAGIPDFMWQTAEKKTQKNGRTAKQSIKPKRKKKARAPLKSKKRSLRKVGYQGFEDADSKEAAPGKDTGKGAEKVPEGFDPSQVPEQYRKYIPK